MILEIKAIALNGCMYIKLKLNRLVSILVAVHYGYPTLATTFLYFRRALLPFCFFANFCCLRFRFLSCEEGEFPPALVKPKF